MIKTRKNVYSRLCVTYGEGDLQLLRRLKFVFELSDFKIARRLVLNYVHSSPALKVFIGFQIFSCCRLCSKSFRFVLLMLLYYVKQKLRTTFSND